MIRIIAILITIPSVYYFLYWAAFAFVPVCDQFWIQKLLSLMSAIGAGWYVWKILGTESTNTILYMLCGAVLIGSIGFAAGFFGPVLFTPTANQGPLLGIFITGPLGFIIGGIGGLVYSKKPAK